MPRDPKLSLRGLDKHDLELVAVAIHAIRNNEGLTSPQEKLIHDLLFRASVRPLEPDDIREAAVEFEKDFEDCRAVCRRFNRDYSKWVAKDRKESLAEYLEQQARDVRSGKIEASEYTRTVVSRARQDDQIRQAAAAIANGKAPEGATSSASHNKNLFQVPSQSGVYNRPFIGTQVGPAAS